MSNKQERSKKKKKIDGYLKYSGFAFQMAGVILGSIFLGKWIDSKMDNDTPYITILLIIVLFSAYLYKLTKELTN